MDNETCGGSVVSKGDKKKNSFDPSRFRAQKPSNTQQVSKTNVMRVPVLKRPSNQQFVRIHADPAFRVDCAILKLDEDERHYLVAADLANSMDGDIKYFCLCAAIDRQSNVFLWCVPPTPTEENENSWHLSYRQIAKFAETMWIRMWSVKAINAYNMQEAEGEIPEPKWPSYSFEQLLEIAFGNSHIIDDPDHPALRKLRGAD
jgi:hypothetical protein